MSLQLARANASPSVRFTTHLPEVWRSSGPHDSGRRVWDGAGKVLKVALHGAQGVVDGACHLLRFLALQPVAEGHAFVGEGGSDFFLLPPGWNADAQFQQSPDA